MLSPEIDKNCQNDFKKHYVHLEFVQNSFINPQSNISHASSGNFTVLCVCHSV